MPHPNLPPRPPGHPAPRDLLAELASHVGEQRAARLCADVLAADDPRHHAETVLFLGGRAGDSVLAGGSWKPYWARTWGARGLLYVWDDTVSDAVLEGLRDEHWRVAEMCLKVSAKRELAGADDATRLTTHELPRVRAAALRVLGVSGDTEHVSAVLTALEDPAEDVRRAAVRALDSLEARLDRPPSR